MRRAPAPVAAVPGYDAAGGRRGGISDHGDAVMTKDGEQYTGAQAWSRRDLLGLGGGLAAGLAVAGRQQLRFVDDPVAGVPELAGGPMQPFPGNAVLPRRRGRPGYRPRPAYPLGKPFGTIAIPALGVNDTLYEGVDLWVLDAGPGHWPGTVLPGQAGNCVIAAHRTSHSAPFRWIDTLRVGDEMRLGALGLEHTYVATEAFIVAPTEVSIVNPTPTNTATIFACHPPGSIALRYVVTFVQA
jgi:LPXTG-site transpeptidase (sortase) family protein